MTEKNTDLTAKTLAYVWGEDSGGIAGKQAAIATPVSIANGGTNASAAKDAAKNLSGIYVLAQSAVASPVTATASETTLATVTIPANLLGANGRLRVTALWSYTNSANTKTLRVRATDGTNSSVLLNQSQTTTAALRAQAEMANRGATNSQVSAPNGLTGYGNTSGSLNTSSMDTTLAITVTITGQLATTSETITLEEYLVEVIQTAGN
jgi:hypothetical protein